MLEGREARGDAAQLAPAVEGFTPVAVPVDAEEQLRRELLEPIEGAAFAEIRRAARPDRADGGGRQHRDHGLGDVRHPGHDPIPGLDAERAQLGGERPYAVAECLPLQRRERLAFAHVEEHIAP